MQTLKEEGPSTESPFFEALYHFSPLKNKLF